MKIRKETTYKFIIILVISSMLIILAYVMMNGLPLMGLPQAEEIASVEISHAQLEIQNHRLTETDAIEKAANAAHLIRLMPGKTDTDPGDLTLIYHLKDGSSYTLESNDTTIIINGKPYRSRELNSSIFLKVIEAMFFYDESAQYESD